MASPPPPRRTRRRAPTSSRPPEDEAEPAPENRERRSRHMGVRTYSQHGSKHALDASHRIRAPEDVYGAPKERTPRTAARVSVPPRREVNERRKSRRSQPPAPAPRPHAVVSSERTARLLDGDPAMVADVHSIRTDLGSQSGGSKYADALEVAQEKPRSNKDRKLAQVPRNEVNAMKEGRVFAMNGIDNLALLMVRVVTDRRRIARTTWHAFPCTCSSRRSTIIPCVTFSKC